MDKANMTNGDSIRDKSNYDFAMWLCEFFPANYISVAYHAIGLDNKKPYIRHGKRFYKPYRNYFSTSTNCNDFELWETLELAGYANSNKIKHGKMFRLTRTGLDWLGTQLGIKIYDEERLK